jgi:hypothetical protein
LSTIKLFLFTNSKTGPAIAKTCRAAKTFSGILLRSCDRFRFHSCLAMARRRRIPLLLRYALPFEYFNLRIEVNFSKVTKKLPPRIDSLKDLRNANVMHGGMALFRRPFKVGR